MDYSGVLKLRPSVPGLSNGTVSVRLLEPGEDRTEPGSNVMTISLDELGRIFIADDMLKMDLLLQLSVTKSDGSIEGSISVPLISVVDKAREGNFCQV